MNQKRNCAHYVYGEKEPWKAFASAVIVQAVKDLYRIMQYKQRLDELRIFFQSGRFVLLTDIDGIQLLKRLEREIA